MLSYNEKEVPDRSAQHNNMNLILLAGNTIVNKDWIEEVETALKPHFQSTHILYYKHWATGEELIDLDKELISLIDLTENVKDFIIFAKSAGTLLTLKGVCEQKIKPIKCIFVGTALEWGRSKGFHVDLWLKRYSIPTLFIQKTNDPAISFLALKKMIIDKQIKNYQLIEVPGDTHHYENVVYLKNLTIEFAK